jgi:hypothetical protein
MKVLVLAATLVAGLTASPLWAADEYASKPATGVTELPPAKPPELEPRQTERGGMVVLRAGPYKPENLLRGSGSGLRYEDMYGKTAGVLYGADWEWQPLHHKWFGALGLGGGASFFRKTGHALREDFTVSKQKTTLMLIPAVVDVTYHLEIWPDMPLVPYAGAGLDGWYFSESKEGGDSVTGLKKGWHWRAGGQILLDTFDERSAGQLDSNWGINNTYLFGEYRNIIMTGLPYGTRNSGFDFSDHTFFGGLMFEY